MNDSYDSLDTLRSDCLTCRGCALCETRTNVVFGTGAPDAKILLIGEGPGESEDLSGEPFVGRSGKLLDLYLEYAGLSRNKNVYIANTVKCRPPKNRDPLPEEKSACRHWLDGQIRILNPSIIVCVGRIAAMDMIKPDFMVTREHGVFFDVNGRLMMGTLHPAALLRDPRKKSDAADDFEKLREKALELGLL